MGQEESGHAAKRIWSLLTEPHSSIQGIRKRQQIRLLSTLLFLSLPIFVYVYLTLELSLVSPYTIQAVIVAIFILYLGSRSQYSDFVLLVALTSFTVLPTVIFHYGSNLQVADLPRLLIWVFVALVAGMLLANTRVVFLQGVVIISIMTVLVLGVYEVPFTEYDAHLGTTSIIMILMLVASFMLESYIRQLDFHAAEADRRQVNLKSIRNYSDMTFATIFKPS